MVLYCGNNDRVSMKRTARAQAGRGAARRLPGDSPGGGSHWTGVGGRRAGRRSRQAPTAPQPPGGTGPLLRTPPIVRFSGVPFPNRAFPKYPASREPGLEAAGRSLHPQSLPAGFVTNSPSSRFLGKRRVYNSLRVSFTPTLRPKGVRREAACQRRTLRVSAEAGNAAPAPLPLRGDRNGKFERKEKWGLGRAALRPDGAVSAREVLHPVGQVVQDFGKWEESWQAEGRRRRRREACAWACRKGRRLACKVCEEAAAGAPRAAPVCGPDTSAGGRRHPVSPGLAPAPTTCEPGTWRHVTSGQSASPGAGNMYRQGCCNFPGSFLLPVCAQSVGGLTSVRAGRSHFSVVSYR